MLHALARHTRTVGKHLFKSNVIYHLELAQLLVGKNSKSVGRRIRTDRIKGASVQKQSNSVDVDRAHEPHHGRVSKRMASLHAERSETERELDECLSLKA